nr:hypothetical protein CFP56_09875 [Quercus suber]
MLKYSCLSIIRPSYAVLTHPDFSKENRPFLGLRHGGFDSIWRCRVSIDVHDWSDLSKENRPFLGLRHGGFDSIWRCRVSIDVHDWWTRVFIWKLHHGSVGRQSKSRPATCVDGELRVDLEPCPPPLDHWTQMEGRRTWLFSQGISSFSPPVRYLSIEFAPEVELVRAVQHLGAFDDCVSTFLVKATPRCQGCPGGRPA